MRYLQVSYTKLRSKVQLSLPPISLSPYLPISPSPYLPISLSNQSTLFECNSVLPLLPTPDSLLPTPFAK
ncbi:MAG: hypothetical protein F6J98_23485 [Moorea sp. SIO4G2]|nr:hypothetical protein [Moorena sp. SIO4G2]